MFKVRKWLVPEWRKMSKTRKWVFGGSCSILLALMLFTVKLATDVKRLMAYENPNAAASLAAVKRDPNDAPAHMSLARHYSKRESRNNALAAQHLREVVRIEPDNREAKSLLGAKLHLIGRKDESVQVFRELAQQQDGWGQSAQKRLQRLGKA